MVGLGGDVGSIEVEGKALLPLLQLHLLVTLPLQPSHKPGRRGWGRGEGGIKEERVELRS